MTKVEKGYADVLYLANTYLKSFLKYLYFFLNKKHLIKL